LTGKSDTDTTDTDDVAALRAALAEANAAKTALASELNSTRKAARDAQLKTMSAEERAIVSQQEACESKIESLDGELADLESQIATLTDEGGRGKEVAALTRKMTAVSAEYAKETGRKDYLESQREKMTGQHKQVREEVAVADQGKVLANGVVVSKLDRRSQDWLEKQPKAFTDVRFAKQIILAAQEAVDVEGITDNSPEFFDFIEQKLGLKEAAAPDNTDGEDIPLDTTERYEPAKPQNDAAGPGKMAAVIARPSRQVPAGGSGGGGKRPTLTNEERETALSLYNHLNISDADKLARYAAGKAFMKNRDNKHFASN
jgi:hypothetical protein